MASGRIGNASGLNVFIDWSSTENSITANLYLYNQYRINTSVNKEWSLTINGDKKLDSVYLGEIPAGTTTLIGSHTVNNLSPNTDYSISGVLDIKLNNYGGNTVNSLNTSGTGKTEELKYTTVWVSERGKTINSISVNWTTADTRWWTQYSLNGGAWQDACDTVLADNKNGYYTINGLYPNTQYTVKTRCKRTGSDLWSESEALIITTHDYAKVSSAPNINFGDTARFTKTNPSGATNNLRIETLEPSATIVTRENIGNDYTITFTDEEWDKLYKYLGNSDSMNIRYVIDTIQNNNKYYDWVDRKLILTGNQKTVRTNVGSKWNRGKLWTNINGIWKRGVSWQNANGTWKRGG